MNSLRDALTDILERHGELTPQIVVEEARPVRSPLHDRVFDCAPKEAAEKWYLTRAASLIRSVRVKYPVGQEGEEHSVRAFLPVLRQDIAGDLDPDGLSTSYEPTEKVLADPMSRAIVLRRAERELLAFKRRYAHLQEFAEIVSRVLDVDAA